MDRRESSSEDVQLATSPSREDARNRYYVDVGVQCSEVADLENADAVVHRSPEISDSTELHGISEASDQAQSIRQALDVGVAWISGQVNQMDINTEVEIKYPALPTRVSLPQSCSCSQGSTPPIPGAFPESTQPHLNVSHESLRRSLRDRGDSSAHRPQRLATSEVLHSVQAAPVDHPTNASSSASSSTNPSAGRVTVGKIGAPVENSHHSPLSRPRVLVGSGASNSGSRSHTPIVDFRAARQSQRRASTRVSPTVSNPPTRPHSPLSISPGKAHPDNDLAIPYGDPLDGGSTVESYQRTRPMNSDKGKGVAHPRGGTDARESDYESHVSESEFEDDFNMVPRLLSPRSRYPPVQHRTVSPSSLPGNLKSPIPAVSRLSPSMYSHRSTTSTAKKGGSAEQTPRPRLKPFSTTVIAPSSQNESVSEHDTSFQSEDEELFDSVSDIDLSQLDISPALPQSSDEAEHRHPVPSGTKAAQRSSVTIIQPTAPTPLSRNPGASSSLTMVARQQRQPAPSVPLVSLKNLPRDVRLRNPHVLAHAPRHQDVWNDLPVGTAFQVALMAQNLGVDLEAITKKSVIPLTEKGNEMIKAVESVLREAMTSQGGGQPSYSRRNDDETDVEDYVTDVETDSEMFVRPGNQTPQATNTSLDQVAAELDWEAEQIILGTGDMLGWREKRGTRYGGKVQFAATLKFNDEDPSGKSQSQKSSSPLLDLESQGRIVLEPLCLRGSSIFTRTLGSHRFLRMRISSAIQRHVGVWSNSSAEERSENKRRLREYVQRPLFILGRVYVPMLEKDGVILYFLEGKESVGEFFEQQFKLPRGRSYGVVECQTLQGLINWWVPLKYNEKQDMSKLATRLELGFSDTLPGVLLEPAHIHVVNDIENDDGTVFTDGAGLMTPSLARTLARKYPTKDQRDRDALDTPVAYQIRVQTAKGVVLIDPDMLVDRNFDGPHRLLLSKSMCKAARGNKPLRPGPVNGMHILDAADCIVCIVKPAPVSASTGVRLSSQFITVLSSCGVPDDVFLQIQHDALEKELEAWTDIETEEVNKGHRINENARLRMASLISHTQSLVLTIKKRELGGEAKGLGYGRRTKRETEAGYESEEETKPSLVHANSFDSFSSMATGSGNLELRSVPAYTHNEISGFPASKGQALHDALLAGIEVHKSNYWLKLWSEMASEAMMRVVAKFHLPVERSACGFLQPDFTGSLKEGEVFFSPKSAMVDSETGLAVQFIEGDVIVGRHPALLPTDMRKVKAVFVPKLQDFKGILFCSIHGELPLASILAGGDYDGDEGTIIWEQRIVQPFKNAPLHLREPPPGFDDKFGKVTEKVSDVNKEASSYDASEYAAILAPRLIASVGEGDTFKIYNSFWNMAVHRYGLWYPENDKELSPAVEMAHKFNVLMDSKKSGLRIRDEELTHDHREWSKFSEPYWRQRQMELDKKETFIKEHNPKSLEPKGGGIPILDRLAYAGEKQVDEEIKRLKDRVDASREENDLFFLGNGTDEDLAAPWNAAVNFAKGNRVYEAQLDAIKVFVKDCFDAMKRISVETARRRCTARQRTNEIRAICTRFAEFQPQLDEGQPSMFGVLDADAVRGRVMASCMYVHDMLHGGSRRGGSTNGLGWQIAFRELCAIKSKTVSKGDTVSLPRTVHEKRETHKYWGRTRTILSM